MMTNWRKLNNTAKTTYGEFGFTTLSGEQMNELIFLDEADKKAEEQFGEFGFKTCSETEQQMLLEENPGLIRK